jgi:hypothetical protein
MKDSPFLSNILSHSAVVAIEALAAAREDTFQQQAELASLVPAQDFKNADLRNVDLTDSDLRGFNFAGADLRGAMGIRVQWDDTTIFDGADLSGSIFAAKLRLKAFFDTDEQANNLLARVSRQSWADQIFWASENLRGVGKYAEFALPVTEGLFYQARNDEFLQAELLRYLAPRMRSKEELYDMLVAALSDEPKAAVVVKSAFSILQRRQLTSTVHIRQQAMMFMKSRNPAIQEEAVRFIVRNNPTPEEIRVIRSAAEASDRFLAGVYVAEITRKLGGPMEVITRDPVSNATLPMKTTVSVSDLNLIARRWLRAESSRNAKDKALPLVQRKGGVEYVSRYQIEQRALKVRKLWSKLKPLGIEIAVEGETESNQQHEVTLPYEEEPPAVATVSIYN